MNKGWGLLFVFLILISGVSAYCNETQTTTYATNSTDYNTSITRTCTEEYDNAGMNYVGLILVALIGVFCFMFYYFKPAVAKGLLLFPIIVLFSFSINTARTFLDVANPSLSSISTTLQWLYVFLTYLLEPLAFILFAWCVYLTWKQLTKIVQNKKLKEEEDWGAWDEW